MKVEEYNENRHEVVLHLSAPEANALLLLFERIDQETGLEPQLEELRENLRRGLVHRSGG